MKRLSIMLIFIFGSIIFLFCNPSRQIKVELEITSSLAGDTTFSVLTLRVINVSDEDLYISSFNPISDISFFDEKGVDVREVFWSRIIKNMPVPEPSLEPEMSPGRREETFIQEAVQLDFDSVQAFHQDSIPYEHRVIIREYLEPKYQAVILIKSGEIFERHFPLKKVDVNSLRKIKLSYNYTFGIKNMTGYTVIKIDNSEYLLPNFPAEEVGHFHLFKGKMKSSLDL